MERQRPEPTPAPSGEVLRDAIAHEEGDGRGQFQAARGGRLRCLTCRQLSDPADQAAEEIERVEGASDPADLALVTRVRCPHCGTSGALVLRYGPEASEDEADLLVELSRRPGAGRRPGV